MERGVASPKYAKLYSKTKKTLPRTERCDGRCEASYLFRFKMLMTCHANDLQN